MFLYNRFTKLQKFSKPCENYEKDHSSFNISVGLSIAVLIE